MNEYELELTTIPGIADPDYLDRLAEVVYGVPVLIDPMIGLNDDGSISASFELTSNDPIAGVQRLVEAFIEAAALVGPIDASAIQNLTIALVTDRHPVPA